MRILDKCVFCLKKMPKMTPIYFEAKMYSSNTKNNGCERVGQCGIFVNLKDPTGETSFQRAALIIEPVDPLYVNGCCGIGFFLLVLNNGVAKNYLTASVQGYYSGLYGRNTWDPEYSSDVADGLNYYCIVPPGTVYGTPIPIKQFSVFFNVKSAFSGILFFPHLINYHEIIPSLKDYIA